MPSPSEWKPDMYVLSRILDRLWKEENGMMRTRLQVATNTSYDNLVRYVTWMTEKGLVTIIPNDGHEVVALTEKGREAYRRIVLWIFETV
ncbi:MAG: hypothetical protein A4E32_01303 [Methanomassiliicoccales archaeon PtaU1.Bin124]|nr:MAG: hypothetical protein A4E32_01303 [Methanomassiliicoccales archaeon PtaU1.Bin124]